MDTQTGGLAGPRRGLLAAVRGSGPMAHFMAKPEIGLLYLLLPKMGSRWNVGLQWRANREHVDVCVRVLHDFQIVSSLGHRKH